MAFAFAFKTKGYVSEQDNRLSDAFS